MIELTFNWALTGCWNCAENIPTRWFEWNGVLVSFCERCAEENLARANNFKNAREVEKSEVLMRLALT